VTRTTTPPALRTTWDRIGAAAGAAYVLLILIGNQLSSGSSSDPHPSGAKDLADFASSPSVAEKVGFTMELLGFLTFMFFLGWLVHTLRLRGGPAAWLGGAAGAAGIVTLSVKVASAMPIMAGRLDHADMSPATARILTDMNGAAFVITFLTFGTFLVAGGLAILTSGLLGRFAGWSAVVIGALSIVLTVLTQGDPVDTNPMPFLAGLVWLLVVSVRLAWKGPREIAAATVGARVAVTA